MKLVESQEVPLGSTEGSADKPADAPTTAPGTNPSHPPDYFHPIPPVKLKRGKKAKPVETIPDSQVSELTRLEAYEHWYLQGLTAGSVRSLQATADHFGVSVQTVRKWYKDFSWEEHTKNRTALVERKLDENAVEKVADVKKFYHDSIHSIIRTWMETRFGEDLGAKQLTVAMLDPETLIKLVRLSLVLMNEPETVKRIEGNITHDVEENIKNLSTDDLKAIVESRRKRLPTADVTVEAEKIELEKDES